jgi:cobalamin biosynthesis Mg chelatase CobN
MANGAKEDDDRRGLMGRVPIPDPTQLTTEALLREIKGLRELMELRIDGVSEQCEANKQKGIAAHEGIKALTEEKFKRVEQQFELVERQRVEQKNDTKAAVDAALTAQKEAVKEQTTASERAIAKSESGTTKQLEQLAENFRTAQSGVITTIDDLKDRVRGIEATKAGGQQTSTQLIALTGVLAAVVAAGVAVIILTR